MRILDALSYCFNPFDPSHHAIENLQKMQTTEKLLVLFKTAIASLFTLGLGTMAALRYFTHRVKIKTGNEKTEEEKNIENVAGTTLLPPKPSVPPPSPPHRKPSPTVESMAEEQGDWFSGIEEQEEIPEELEEVIVSQQPQKPAVSQETIKNRAAVIEYLKEKEHRGTLGIAHPTGDCFYDSVAQVLTQLEKEKGSQKEFSKRDMRKDVSDYLNNLTDPVKIKKFTDLYGGKEKFNEYKKRVHLTVEDCNEQKEKHNAVAAEKEAKIQELKAKNADEAAIRQAEKELQDLPLPPIPLWGGEGDVEILEEIYQCNIVTVNAGVSADRTKAEIIETMSTTRSNKPREDLPTLRIALLFREFQGHYDPIFPPEVAVSHLESEKLKTLRQKHKDQLAKFEQWALSGNWNTFHTSHYDWWMFPIMRSSDSYRDEFTFSKEGLASLKADSSFMKDFRRGVQLELLAWGWDTETGQPVSHPGPDQAWTKYGVRLGKLATSLRLLGENDLYQKVQEFAKANKVKADPWVIQALGLN